MPADEMEVDGWALISQLISSDQPVKTRKLAVKQPRGQPNPSANRQRRGWPKGKPRGKRVSPLASNDQGEEFPEGEGDVEYELKKDPIDAASQSQTPTGSGDLAAGMQAGLPRDPPPAEEPSRKKRRTSSLSRNILMTATSLYRPGWFPLRGRPLHRGKGFSTMEDAIKNRDLLEIFMEEYLDKYTELTDQTYEVFAKAVDICGWRTDITASQLHAEVWESIKLLMSAQHNLAEDRRQQGRQRIKPPAEITRDTSDVMVSMAQIASRRSGLGISFIQGLLGPQWTAPVRIEEDIMRVARSIDVCFSQIASFAKGFASDIPNPPDLSS